jgi:hypothetical protein
MYFLENLFYIYVYNLYVFFNIFIIYIIFGEFIIYIT